MPDLSRDRIVACARDLIRSEGMRALGLRRVARELDVTAPALYTYVSNFDALVRAVAEGLFEDLSERFDAVTASDPVATVRAHSHAYVAFALDEPELFKVLVRYPPAIAGDGTEHELPAATKAFMAACEPLQTAMDAGALRPQDPTWVALVIWAAVHGCATVLNMGFGFDRATANRLTDDVIDTVLAGLAA